MGIAYEGCRWCHGRPGGCLYCAEERAWNDQLKIMKEMAIARERFVLDGLAQGAFRLVRFTEIVEGPDGASFVERHQDGVQQLARDVAARGSGTRVARPSIHICSFIYEPPHFQIRACVCGRRQRFEWLPNSLSANGRWIEVLADGHCAAKETFDLKPKPKPRRNHGRPIAR